MLRIGDLNQIVAIGIIRGWRVHPPLPGGAQHRVIAGRAEVPSLVGEIVPVHIHPPVGVNPGVPRGGFQVGGAGGGNRGGGADAIGGDHYVADALGAGRAVAVAVGGRVSEGPLNLADESGDIGAGISGGRRPGGVAGIIPGEPGTPHQPAGINVGRVDIGIHRRRAVHRPQLDIGCRGS